MSETSDSSVRSSGPSHPGGISDEEHDFWQQAARRAYEHAKNRIDEALDGLDGLTDRERGFLHGIAWNGGTDELTSLLRKVRRAARRPTTSTPAHDEDITQLVDRLLGADGVDGGDLDKLTDAVNGLPTDDLIDLREAADVLTTAIDRERSERDWVRRHEG
ncbi:hypothetical protein GCM10023196_036330 [Actinoallomurus vinaceus]|uniref:Uncharacterized protein n=1 Tax=Actinoallomurus vinaceus TaxID=1080074 RepID=A0ABP8UCC8_9ACTN